MRRVIFLYETSNGAVQYPDDISFFANTVITDDGINILADYTGTNNSIADAPPTTANLTISEINATASSIDIMNVLQQGLTELTVEKGATVSFKITSDIDLNAKYRVPFTHGDKVIMVLGDFTIDPKVATISAIFDDSGIWTLSDDYVNVNNADDLTFVFDDLRIYVLQKAVAG